MERFVDDALVLSTLDYGEADRIVTLFTRAHGRLSAFAGGARKSKRRFAGALEPGTQLKASLVSRHGDTFRLDAVDVVKAFHRLTLELPSIARALYGLELCRELTRDHQPHEALFDALVVFLTALDDGRAGPAALVEFQLDALEHTGFRPRFGPCALCGRALGDQARFDAEAGGSVCASCRPAGRFVPAGLIEALARVQAGEGPGLSTQLAGRARELLELFITHHLGRRLRSVDFLLQAGD